MCGIAGYFDSNCADGNRVLNLMSDTLFHRGPDAGGMYIDNAVGLCHRRLSIIDLSVSANQPMHSNCGRYAIVFNGEIYNFNEIKQKLNTDFKTNSDTEVILESFRKWGSNCVNYFNGMFAFVILDKQLQTIHLFRDRIGVKPLFYFLKNSRFYFASEIKALVAVPEIKREISTDINSMNSFLHLGYIPQPDSIYCEIKKFPAASYASYDGAKFLLHKYWDVYSSFNNTQIVDLDTAKTRLNDLLIDSVRLRLISDVPYGVFLSGGIDSSLVAAIASRQIPEALNTFTIGFKNAMYDESSHAKIIASNLGAKHTEYILDPKEAINLVLTGIDLFDEPFADSSFLPTMIVSELAGKSVKMVLSGDGGDELFYGYGVYNWVRRLNNPILARIRPFLVYLLRYYGSRGKRVSDLLKLPLKGSIRSHLFSQEQYLFSQQDIRSVLKEEKQRDYTIPDEEQINSMNLSMLEKQALFDLLYYLRDDLLVKVDRSSMHYSLECRLPLLDYRIVEYSNTLHPSLKLNGKVMKYVEKQLLYDYLPQNLFNRPKWGFSVPLQTWLKSDLKYLIDDYLNEYAVASADLLNFDFVKKLVDNYLNKGYDHLYNRIWQLIVLQRWILKSKDIHE